MRQDLAVKIEINRKHCQFHNTSIEKKCFDRSRKLETKFKNLSKGTKISFAILVTLKSDHSVTTHENVLQ